MAYLESFALLVCKEQLNLDAGWQKPGHPTSWMDEKESTLISKEQVAFLIQTINSALQLTAVIGLLL